MMHSVYFTPMFQISAPSDSEAGSLFTLEGFDEEQEQKFFDQSDDNSKVIAFPQSDDEDDSTNGI